MNTTVAIVLAGGAGERLQPLTRERAKAAVPFGGKFRIIDFTLSSCVNSGLRHIFVLTQYRSTSLLRHIQDGWGISSAGLGDFIYCVPAQQKLGVDWYRGTADAVRQNVDLFRTEDLERVLVLSADHVYKMNYQQMVAYHEKKKADVTVAAIRVRKEQAAGRLGVIEVDSDYRMIGFEEKPTQPKTIPEAPDYALGSMGVYMFQTSVLREILEIPGDDFGQELIPRALGKGYGLFVYDYEERNSIGDSIVTVENGRRTKTLVDRARDSSYWRDVGTIDSYYEANMDLVGVDPVFNLYGERWPLRTCQRALPPSKSVLGGRALDSIVSDGCIISGGTVLYSILSPGAVVERDALVEHSIIFDDVIIEPNARVRWAIIDKEVRIRAGATIGYDHEADRKRGCTISPNGIVVVPKGADVAPG